MVMYGLQKYENLYSSLRGKHIFESICRQQSLSQPWVIPGHIFVATNDARNLYVFDVVPNTVYGQTDNSLDILAEECLLTENEDEQVLEILCDYRSDLVYIVYVGGTVHVWNFNKSTYLWERQCEFQLSNTKFVKIAAVALHTALSSIVWCEERTTGSTNSNVFCVCTREVPRSFLQNAQSSLGPVNAVLHNCPPVRLFLSKDCCCIQPCVRSLSDIFLYWHGFSRRLKVFMLNNNDIIELPISSSSDFRSIATELLPLWGNSRQQNTASILAMTTHSTTRELIVLNKHFQVYCFTIKEGEPCHKKLCTLTIPKQVTEDSRDKMKDVFIFSHTLVIGVVFPSSIIQVYDLKSGQLLKCFASEFNVETSLSLWKCLSPVPQVGVWSKCGVWVLVSKSIIDIVNSLKVVSAINKDASLQESDQDSTGMESEHYDHQFMSSQPSENKLESKRQSICCSILSVLMSWGLDDWAANTCIDLMTSDVEQDSYDKETIFNILQSKHSAQLLLVLIAVFGMSALHRERVTHVVEEFVNSNTTMANRKSFSDELLPYLQDYLHVSKIHDALEQKDITISQNDFPSLINPVFLEAKELLQVLLGEVEPGIGLEERLSLLKLHSPEELFEVMKQTFLNENPSKTKVFVNADRWRHLLGLRLNKGELVRDSECNPLLGIFCQLIYEHQPGLLVDFLHDLNYRDPADGKTANMASHFIECTRSNLSIVSVPYSKSPSVKSYARVLTLTGCYLEALQLLIRAGLWEESLELTTALCETLDSSSQVAELYQTLFCGLIKGDASARVVSQALKIKPKDFGILELISLLKQGLPSMKPFSNNTNLTVGLLRGDLLKLLQA